MKISISGKTLIRIVLYGIIILGFIGLLINWTAETIIHSRKEVVVPNLIGKQLFEALESLEPLNLGMRKTAVEFNREIPTGTVIRQHPSQGATVREGRIVQVSVAMGSESVFMPQLASLTLRQAEIKLRSLGLLLGEIARPYSLKYPAETVISQSPAAAARVPKESIVNITVSAGSPPSDMLLMPDFVGQNIDQAMKWSMDKGVSVEYLYEDNFKLVGKIISQTPPFDTVLTSTHVVTVVGGK